MSKTTKTEPVARNALGQVVKGSGAINPGGITADERAKRDALRLWLTEETPEKGKAAYLKALEDGNPAIIKDWADRMFGKVQDLVKLSGDADSPLEWTKGATLEQVLEIVRSGK